MGPAPDFRNVRPFREEHIPHVADLHRKVFRIAEQLSPALLASYSSYFRHVFLQAPWQDWGIGSLVYEQPGGSVAGFLGVANRRMRLKGRLVHASISSQFIVDHQSRGIAGLQLLRAFLDGPQDLSIADEANTAARAVWEALGGTTSLVHSMRWLFPLRPVRLATWLLCKRRRVPPALSLLTAPVDWLLQAINPFRPKPSRLSGQDLDSHTLRACLAEYASAHSLHPDYDHAALNSLLHRAESLRRNGRLQKVLVTTAEGRVAGWYLYYLHSSGLSEVVQIYAKPECARAVLDHLFDHAARNGATALSGRLEPAWMQTLSDRHCPVHCGPQWVLVHSREPELLNAFTRGDVFFSRLDGEWCLHFQ